MESFRIAVNLITWQFTHYCWDSVVETKTKYINGTIMFIKCEYSGVGLKVIPKTSQNSIL